MDFFYIFIYIIPITKIYLVENCYGDPNKVYIGKTKCSRKNDHELTYGQQITYTYIDEVESIKYEDWGPLEKYWIEQFKQWGFEVVNRNKGGGGPSCWDDNLKLKMSLSKKGKLKPMGFGNKISKSKKGIPRLDIKGRISPNKGNYILHLKTRKAIIQYDKQMNIVQEWNSPTEAGINLNIDRSQISAVARGNTKWKTAGGFIFKYKNI